MNENDYHPQVMKLTKSTDPLRLSAEHHIKCRNVKIVFIKRKIIFEMSRDSMHEKATPHGSVYSK